MQRRIKNRIPACIGRTSGAGAGFACWASAVVVHNNPRHRAILVHRCRIMIAFSISKRSGVVFFVNSDGSIHAGSWSRWIYAAPRGAAESPRRVSPLPDGRGETPNFQPVFRRRATRADPARRRLNSANVEGSGTGAGPLPKGIMSTPIANAGTGEPEASAAGLALAMSTPELPMMTVCPGALLLEERPRLDTRHQRIPARRRSKRPWRAGRRGDHLQRAGQDRRAAAVVVEPLPYSPRTTMPPPALSITLNWPGPVRVPLLMFMVWPLASSVATSLATVPTVWGHAIVQPRAAGLERPAGEVEGGSADNRAGPLGRWHSPGATRR